MIDRNLRARLGAKIRQDSRMTATERHVANASLFACTDAKTGRSQAYRARLAHEAACSERSVTRATNKLQELGYVRVIPTYGPRKRIQDGRWFRPRGANVLEWLPILLTAKPAADPSISIKKEAAALLPDGLAAVLTRFGSAVADRFGLPQASAAA